MVVDRCPVLILASRNRKKLEELRGLLPPERIRVRSLSEFPDLPDVVEDGASFGENAGKKAAEIARAADCWALGEDSGLEVDALGGAPGIYSARYSDPGATDERNNAKLMQALEAIEESERSARYVCHIALADRTGRIVATVEETCRGLLTREARGANGFGYDPYFLVREYHRTFGELWPIVKQQISHRGRAMRRMIPLIKQHLGAD